MMNLRLGLAMDLMNCDEQAVLLTRSVTASPRSSIATGAGLEPRVSYALHPQQVRENVLSPPKEEAW